MGARIDCDDDMYKTIMWQPLSADSGSFDCYPACKINWLESPLGEYQVATEACASKSFISIIY